MAESIAEFVDRIRRHYDDGCFACGRDNPLGLHLDDFSLDDGVVSARFQPRLSIEGPGTAFMGEWPPLLLMRCWFGPGFSTRR